MITACSEGTVRGKGWGDLFHYKFWQNFRDASGVKGNLSGNGQILGGFMLIGKGADGIKWTFKEVHYGDKPTRQDIMGGINALVPMEPMSLPKKTEESKPAEKPKSPPASSSSPKAATSSSPKPEASSSPKPTTSASPKPATS